MTSKQRVTRALGICVCVALNLTAADTVAAQKKTAPTKKPAPPTTVTPTASEGSTATAIRGRPANPAAAKAVAAALKTALAKPAVKNAVRAEVLRQLRSQHPIAVISNAWVTVVKLGPVYAIPSIRTELVSSLGSNGSQLIDAAGGGLAIAFTAASLGRLLMPDIVRDVEAAIGVDALKGHITEGLIGDLVGAALDGVDGVVDWNDQGILQETFDFVTKYGPSGDWDQDGIANWRDDDDDNDGVKDDKDRFPRDSSKSICDCGRGRAMAFGSVTTDFLPTLINAASAAARGPRVALGPAIAGQPGILAIVF